MRKMWYVVRADGRAFCGVSSITGEPMWFDCAGDSVHLSDMEALRYKRDARWLALARKYDASAEWKEL